jgi:DNA-binding response OmpR family regulator
VADVVLSEATAAELLPRQVARILGVRENFASRVDRPAFRIDVASGNYELSMAVSEACTAAGYRACQVGDAVMRETPGRHARLAAAAERVLTIWDAPVLEPAWCERLKQYSAAAGPVIALIGFADRSSVTQAKNSGAVACLELPFNVDDLLHVIDRTARSLPPESWTMPARVEPPHLLPPRPRRRASRPEAPAPETATPWPDHDRLPTIP